MTQDYRSEARAARAEAQAKLKALREARRQARPATAHRRVAAPVAPPPADPPCPAPDSVSLAGPALRVTPAALDLSRQALATPAEDADAPMPDPVSEPGSLAAQPAIPAPDLSDGHDAGDAAPPAPSPEATAAGPQPGACPLPDPEASDLTALPGIGPGLILLFGRAGVHSLADLAAAEADALRPQLGLAGQFLDLDAWIGTARAAGPAGPDPAS